jgi:hypothetical protein
VLALGAFVVGTDAFVVACILPRIGRSVLLILGVPERTVMDIMGWSSSSMARRYQHITAEIRKDIARRVGDLIWDDDDDQDDGIGGVRAPRRKRDQN